MLLSERLLVMKRARVVYLAIVLSSKIIMYLLPPLDINHLLIGGITIYLVILLARPSVLERF